MCVALSCLDLQSTTCLLFKKRFANVFMCVLLSFQDLQELSLLHSAVSLGWCVWGGGFLCACLGFEV